jgi:uncharacterized membrane protein YdjX (TVP38/TMEM64 family)
MRFKRYWKILAGLAVLVVIALALRGAPILQWLEALSGTIRSFGLWGVALYALLFACAAMLCIPCMPLTVAAGLILGTASGAIAVHAGTCIAAACGFFIGRVVGRAHIADWVRRSNRFRFIDDAIAREGWKIVALLRMHALPFGLSNYIYGMTGVGFWHYFLATVFAMLPGNIIFVHLGAIGGRKITGQGGMHPLEFVLVGLGVVSLFAMGRLVTRLVRTHRATKLAEAPESRA